MSDLQKKWEKSVADFLVGKTIKSVSYMTDAEAKEWDWYKRPIKIQFTDGHEIMISQDDEGNDGGSVFTTSKDLPTIPTLSRGD